MRYPLDDREAPVTQDWDEESTRHIYARAGLQGHNGLDLGAGPGSLVRAMAAGKVVYAGDGAGDPVAGSAAGNYVRIDHPDMAVQSGYAHLENIWVKAGDEVYPGDVLGSVGKTGMATGYHLHVEVLTTPLALDNGWAGRVDPRPYLDIPLPSEPVAEDVQPLTELEAPALDKGTPVPVEDESVYAVAVDNDYVLVADDE